MLAHATQFTMCIKRYWKRKNYMQMYTYICTTPTLLHTCITHCYYSVAGILYYRTGWVSSHLGIQYTISSHTKWMEEMRKLQELCIKRRVHVRRSKKRCTTSFSQNWNVYTIEAVRKMHTTSTKRLVEVKLMRVFLLFTAYSAAHCS